MDSEKVRILNSEINTHFYLYVRPDRLRAFYEDLLYHRQPDYKSSPMPGLSWNAILGLDAIFDRRPKKFPARDIISWLIANIPSYTHFAEIPVPPVTPDEMEKALERFSTMYPPDASAEA